MGAKTTTEQALARILASSGNDYEAWQYFTPRKYDVKVPADLAKHLVDLLTPLIQSDAVTVKFASHYGERTEHMAERLLAPAIAHAQSTERVSELDAFLTRNPIDLEAILNENNYSVASRMQSLRARVRRNTWCPPMLVDGREDYARPLNNHYGVEHSVGDLIALGSKLPLVADFLDANGLPSRSLRTSPQAVRDEVRSRRLSSNSSLLQADVALNGSDALFHVLATYPAWTKISRKLRSPRPLVPLAQQVTTNKWLTSDEAKTLLPYVLSELEARPRDWSIRTGGDVEAWALLQPFYDRLVDHPVYRPFAIAGALRFHSRPGWEEYALRLLERTGLDKQVRGVPQESILELINRESHASGTFQQNDPIGLRTIRSDFLIHDAAMRKAKRLFPNAQQPTFSTILYNRSLTNAQIRFLVDYTERNCPVYQSPTLTKLVELTAPTFLKGSMPDLRRLAGVLDASKDRFDKPVFDQLVERFSEQKLSHEAEPRVIDLCASARIVEKYLADDPIAKQRWELLVEIVRDEVLRSRNADKLIVNKEQAPAVLEKLTDSWVHSKISSRLPYSRQFLDGLVHAPKATYTVLHKIATQDDLATVLYALLQQTVPYDGYTAKHISVGWDNTGEYKENNHGALLPAYNHYVRIERKLRRFTAADKKRVQAERATLTSLDEQMQRFELPAELNEESWMDDELPEPITSGVGTEHRRARYHKAHAIVSRQIARTISYGFEVAYSTLLADMLGTKKNLPAIDASLRNAIELYGVLAEHPDHRAAVARVVRTHVAGSRYDLFQHEENRVFAQQLAERGIDLTPWLKGMRSSYEVSSDDAQRIEYNRQHHERDLTHILDQNGIPTGSLEERLDLAKTAITNADVHADIAVQVAALREYSTKLTSTGVHRVEIAIETDPMRELQMGSLVDHSCLRPAGGNGRTAVVNTLDVNKRALYAYDENGAVVGRRLVGLTDSGALVQYATYRRGDLALDKSFEHFTAQLAQAMSVPLANYGNVPDVLGLVSKNDDTQAFRYVPLADLSEALY